MSPKKVVVIVDGGILSVILQALTRYSANDPQFPVNDWSLFTGKSHAIGGADDIRAVQFAEELPSEGVAVGLASSTRRCRVRVRSDAFSRGSAISSNRSNDQS